MSKQTQFKKYSVFGVEIDAITNSQAIDLVIGLASNPKSATAYVTKPYVEFLDLAYNNDKIISLLNASYLCAPDGVALNWAVYYLYGGKRTLVRWFTTLTQIALQPSTVHNLLPERAGGTNLAWPMLEAATNKQLKVYLIGTPDGGRGDIAKTASTIKQRLPNINLVGHYGGFFPPGDESELIDLLKTTKPDLILVGMGFPKQEYLMAKLSQQLPHGILVGEGGTFDYTSFGGKEPKAPHWIQTIGLEWLWRLMHQPSRIRRQLAIPRFMWRVYLEGKNIDT